MPTTDLQDRFIETKSLEDGDSSDGGENKPAKRSGRRKIKIEYIEDKNRRHITFSKRKAGIMKKAYELSTLTGTQVLLLVVSETGLVYTFTTVKLQPIVTNAEGKNLIQACLNTPDPDQEEENEAPQDQSAASNDNLKTERIKKTEPSRETGYTAVNYDNRPYQPYPPTSQIDSAPIPPINPTAYGYVDYRQQPQIQKPTPQPPQSSYAPPNTGFYGNPQYPGYWTAGNDTTDPLKQEKK
ncbi:hypothetical protein G6F56_007973 [Rhizopus delemar]|nr:hypothetical protein G6F56_007973 [Rhizopus delemar]